METKWLGTLFWSRVSQPQHILGEDSPHPRSHLLPRAAPIPKLSILKYKDLDPSLQFGIIMNYYSSFRIPSDVIQCLSLSLYLKYYRGNLLWPADREGKIISFVHRWVNSERENGPQLYYSPLRGGLERWWWGKCPIYLRLEQSWRQDKGYAWAQQYGLLLTMAGPATASAHTQLPEAETVTRVDQPAS